MATASLTIMYCLNLTLSNGGIKPFELHNPKSSQENNYYYTPPHCTSENEFWIKRSGDIPTKGILDSPFDFYHREYLTNATNAWLVRYFHSDYAVSITINGIQVRHVQKVGLNEGDQIRLKYTNMPEPLDLVYGKCSPINKIVPTECVTTLHLNPTETTTLQTESTTHKFDLTESATNDALRKELMISQGNIENLEKLVKVLNAEMETQKLKMEQPNQRISNTSELPKLTISIVLFVLATSIVIAFTIYQLKLQDKKIKTLSIHVYRYRSDSEVQRLFANIDNP